MGLSSRSWIRRLFAVSTRHVISRQSSKLRLLELEERAVPATYTVTNTASSGTGSLYAAITSANGNPGADTIVFSNTTTSGATNFYNGSAHTITGSLPIITDSVTIAGAAPSLTFIDPASNSRVFTISDGMASGAVNVALENMTIENAHIVGPVTASSGYDVFGGGIAFNLNGASQSGDTLLISNCDIKNNTIEAGTRTDGTGGKAYGGGLYATGVAVTISHSTFDSNLAKGGTDTKTYDNRPAKAFGGAINVNGTSVLTTLNVNNSTITGNTAMGGKDYNAYGNMYSMYQLYSGNADGGAIYFDSHYTVTSGGDPLFKMVGTEVDNNEAEGGELDYDFPDGHLHAGDALVGGVDALTEESTGTTITAESVIEDSTFSGNAANGGSATIKNIGLHGITVGSAAGGSAFTGGVVASQLINSTVTGDIATGGNAGAYSAYYGNNTNATPGMAAGGGFGPGHGTTLPGYLFSAVGTDYTISASTIVGNTARGGIAYPLQSSTRAVNTFGGGVDDGDPTFVFYGPSPVYYITNYQNVVLLSTIVADNTANYGTHNGDPVAPGPDIVGGGSDSHNLIGQTDLSAPNFPQSPFTGGPVSYVPQSNTMNGGNADLVGPDPNAVSILTGLASLAYNGGPTKTMLPTSGGYALDNGANGLTVMGTVIVPAQSYDQRGFPFSRTVNQSSTGTNENDHTDVGAVEYRTTPPTTLVYVDEGWTGLSPGASVTNGDADPVMQGNQPATIGTNAFATYAAAFMVLSSGDTVIVNGANAVSGGSGVYSEDVEVPAGVTMILQAGNVTTLATLDKAPDMTFDTLKIDSTASVTVTDTWDGGTGGIVFAVTSSKTFSEQVYVSGSIVTQSTSESLHSEGNFTVEPGTADESGLSGRPTDLIDKGGADMYFSGGSYSIVGSPETSPTVNNGYAFAELVDVQGQNIIVSGTSTGGPPVYTPGTTFVNDGFLVDSVATGTIISDGLGTTHGALVKGSGYFEYSAVTRNGGFFQAGNSPGVDTVGSLKLGPNGAGGLVFCINNATGVAGSIPDASDHVSGWSLIDVDGDFTMTADAEQRLTIDIQTLANPTTPGNDVVGEMNNFDPAQSYVWELVHWTGTYSGPTDSTSLNAAVVFDAGAMANAAGGKFSVRLDSTSKTLSVVYTPPPAVAAVQANYNGSGIQSITVTFSAAVTFASSPAQAFQLTDLDTGLSIQLVAVVSTDGDGRTVVTLTFDGETLSPGRYQLGISSAAVTGSDGSALDGDGLGLTSGDFLSPIWTVG